MASLHDVSGWPAAGFDLADRPYDVDSTANAMPWHGDIDVSVVIPDIGDRAAMAETLSLIPNWVSEIVLVTADDFYTTTIDVNNARPSVRVIVDTMSSLGGALRVGFENAKGDAIVAVLPDDATDPEEIPLYVGALMAGADVVLGTRFAQGGSSARLSRSDRLFNSLLRPLVNHRARGAFTDVSHPIFAARNTAVTDMFDDRSHDLSGRDLAIFLRVRPARRGLNVSEVPSFRTLDNDRCDGRGLPEKIRRAVGVAVRAGAAPKRGQQRLRPRDLQEVFTGPDLACE